MTKLSDSALRELVRKATVDAGNDLPWFAADSFDGNIHSTNGAAIAECYGGRDRFHVAALMALAPDLARELLAARKVVRAARAVSRSYWCVRLDRALDAYGKRGKT